MEDTWASRDLPVLDATVQMMETNPLPAVRDIAAAAGMDIEATGRALQALASTYVELSLSSGGPESWNVRAVSADARRAVGQWPTAESLITRLAEAFGAAAEREPDPEKKGPPAQHGGHTRRRGRAVPFRCRGGAGCPMIR